MPVHDSAIIIIKRYTRHLIVAGVASVLLFILFHYYSIGTPNFSIPNLLMLAFGFVISITWFPLYYLHLYGHPEPYGQKSRLLSKLWFFFIFSLVLLFWLGIFIRTLLHFLAGI
jgi:hypothetical protein